MVLLKVRRFFRSLLKRYSACLQGCRTIYLCWTLYEVWAPETRSGNNRLLFVRCLPDFPHLEHEYDQVALIAFPMSIKDRDREIVWLLCEDVDDLK